MEAYKILDLFAGAGGLSLGFELYKDNNGNNPFEFFRGVEINKYACETLRNRYGDKKIIEGDLTSPEIHKRVIKECKDKVSIVMGGIPCQSFSLIGPRSGYGRKKEQFVRDKRDELYKEFKKIVTELNPKIVIIENVKGILSKKDGKGTKIIDSLINDFEEIGYCFENSEGNKYIILNAADFGVPQKRERVILVGISRKWKSVKIPVIKPTHYNPNYDNDDSRDNLLPYVTLYDAISDLPEVSSKITKTDLNKNRIRNIEKINRQIDNGADRIPYDFNKLKSHINKLGKSGKDFLYFVRPNGYPYLDNHVARSHQYSDIQLFKKMLPGETAFDFIKRNPKQAGKLIKYNMDSFKDKYRKQSWDKPSTTIFAHLEKDGNRFIHPLQPRTFTPREAARIQSFPDDFTFMGPFSQKYKQIGNAVPPLMSYNLAKTINGVLVGI